MKSNKLLSTDVGEKTAKDHKTEECRLDVRTMKIAKKRREAKVTKDKYLRKEVFYRASRRHKKQ